MPRSHWGFANTLHSKPHEDASLRETAVCTTTQRENCVQYTSDTLHLMYNTVDCITLLSSLNWPP